VSPAIATACRGTDAYRARNTPFPTIHQLNEVFDILPDEPKGPTRKLGPQYDRPQRTKPEVVEQPPSMFRRLAFWLRPVDVGSSRSKLGQGNFTGALRNGDRGLVVAVNDSGNTGWVRFGRSGFAEFALM
jgi:tRNA-splicing endonuclease subunit Sen54